MIKQIAEGFVSFFKDHYIQIITILVLALFMTFVFLLTSKSLKKLKPEVFSSYPFDLFFPAEGKWSVGYFLIILLFLGALVYFVIKGNFYFGPA